MYKRIKTLYQEALAFIEEKLGLHAEFENTLDRWKRKSLVRRIDNPTKVQKFTRDHVARLRDEPWDDILEKTRQEPKDFRPKGLVRSDSGQPPNKRRLRRFYRWQLREDRRRGPVHRETYDDLVRATLADTEV